MIKTADWIIDLGPKAWPGLDPGASDGGGQVVAAGTPEQVTGRPNRSLDHIRQ